VAACASSWPRVSSRERSQGIETRDGEIFGEAGELLGEDVGGHVDLFEEGEPQVGGRFARDSEHDVKDRLQIRLGEAIEREGGDDFGVAQQVAERDAQAVPQVIVLRRHGAQLFHESAETFRRGMRSQRFPGDAGDDGVFIVELGADEVREGGGPFGPGVGDAQRVGAHERVGVVHASGKPGFIELADAVQRPESKGGVLGITRGRQGFFQKLRRSAPCRSQSSLIASMRRVGFVEPSSATKPAASVGNGASFFARPGE
jgi:hypothetical protein